MKPHELAATYNIIGIPLVDARANFLIPAKFGDVIEIASRVEEFRRSSFDVAHRISIDGKLAIEGGETRVWAARLADDPEQHRRRRHSARSHCQIWLISVAPRVKVQAIPSFGPGEAAARWCV